VTTSDSSIANVSRAASRLGLRHRIRSLIGLLLAGRGTSGAAAQTMIVRTFILGINVLTGIASARLLGPAAKGEQAAIISWTQMIPFCVTLGIPASLLFHVRSKPRDESRLFAAALLLSATSGALAAGFGAVALPFWLRHFDHRAILCSQLLMLTVPGAVVFYAAQGVIDARAKFALENLLALATVLLTVLALFALYLTDDVSSVTVALAYALTGTPACIFGIVYAIRVARPKFRDLRGSARTLLHFGLRYYAGDLFTVLVGFADQILIAGFLAPHVIGVYVVIASLCRMLNLVQQSISVVLFPRVVGQPIDVVVEDVQRAARITLAMALVPALLIGFGGGELVRLVYGPGFVPSAVMVWLLLGDTVVGGVGRVLSQAMTSVGRPGIVTILTSVQFVVSVSLCLALIHRYQIVGVAASMFTGTTVRFLLTMVCYPIVLRVPTPKLTPSLSDAKFIYHRMWASI
jgi:O-antigen/teichoic acid export membrane protein